MRVQKNKMDSVARAVLFLLSHGAHGVYLVKMALRRLYAYDCAPFPGNEVLSLAWLNRVLAAHKIISGDQRCISATAAPLAVNRGLVGTIARFTLTYNVDDATLPKSLILKTSGASVASRRAVMFGGQNREAKLYCNKAIMDALPEGILPAVLYAHESYWLGEYTILMEDMTLRNVTPVNFVMGNQIW